MKQRPLPHQHLTFSRCAWIRSFTAGESPKKRNQSPNFRKWDPLFERKNLAKSLSKIMQTKQQSKKAPTNHPTKKAPTRAPLCKYLIFPMRLMPLLEANLGPLDFARLRCCGLVTWSFCHQNRPQKWPPFFWGLGSHVF